MLTHVSAIDRDGNIAYTFNSQYKVVVPQRYEVSSMVGRGAYGIVCSAIDKTTGDTVAIKKISNVFDEQVDGKRILREVKLLGFLRHPNILSLKDIFRPMDPGFSDLYLVTELMSSDLHSLLRSSKVKLSDGHCRYFTYQLLCALRYIHSADVIHRDLKPENLLTNADCDLKLCDFGLARGRGPNMSLYVVTRWYRPPELLFVSDDYDGAVDMWGVACLVAEMITRRPLFCGRDYIHQLNLITALLGAPNINEDIPQVQSDEARSFLKSLPQTEPQPIEAIVPNIKEKYISAFRYGVECQQGDAADINSEENKYSSERETNSFTEDTDSNINNNNNNNNNDDNDTALEEQRYRLFKDFLFKLLRYNPKERMTAAEALEHPWLKGVRANCADELEADAAERFFWEFDGDELSIAQVRQLLLSEIIKRTN